MRRKPAPIVELATDEEKEFKKSYRLSKEEREVSINRTEVDDHWTIYTSSKSTMTRLDKWTKPTQIHYMGGEVVAKEYEIPIKCVSIHRPRKVSEAMRQRGLQLAMESKVKKTPDPQ